LEHIVVDDGSSDRTMELLSELKREIPSLTVIRQANRGAGPARNAGIDAAEGRYIAFLDSDDAWLECKLENQISFMEEQEGTFTYGDYAVVDGENGESIGQFVTPASLGYDQLLTRCPIGCSTVAYNQDILGKRYMPAIRRGQDWALWLALTRRGVEARKYPGCDVTYYMRKGSLSKRKLLKAIDMYRIYTVEEKIGRFHSGYLLARFAVNVMTRKL
jgi:teichuronic acid biosynthesis glycosyltransferase TuaG